jgi:hypothetical protein
MEAFQKWGAFLLGKIRHARIKVDDQMAVTQITQAKKRFLNHYAKHGRFYAAAKYAGRTGKTVYLWLDRGNATYDARVEGGFEDVKRQFMEKLEAEADRRATEGVKKPMFWQGKPVLGPNGAQVIIREYSDTLLMFRLKALDPAKYRDNVSAEITGKDGQPLFADLLARLRGLDDNTQTR